jgi:hypothetical protein
MPFGYEMETFDDICNGHTQPLLFRLQSRSINPTPFNEERKRLVATNFDQRSFSRAVEELSQNEQSYFIDVEEDVEAIQRHINSLVDRNREPSDFISLTLSLLWVLWKWKLLTSMGFRDDFKVIVVRSSPLVGRAKLATEVLDREEHRTAYRFADSADEVIVAKIVQPQAILGAVPLSRLTEFIPSWLRRPLGNVRRRRGPDDNEVPESSFNTFLEVLDPPNDDVEGIRDSLGLALAILAPMLVQSKQEEPQELLDLIDLLSNLVISQPAPEYGYVSPCRTFSWKLSEHSVYHSRNLAGSGQLPWNMEAVSQPEARSCQISPAKQGRLRTTNTGRGSRASTSFAEESKYVGALAAQVYCGGMRMTRWGGLHEDCTEHAQRLLGQYRTAMRKG